MPISPLEALVQGFQENREHQERQAKTLADAEARKFEQKYRLDQAKQQAEYQAAQLQQGKERASTANFNALINAQAKQQAEERKRQEDEDKRDALKIKYDHLRGAIDFRKEGQTAKILSDLTYKYEQGGLSNTEARARAERNLHGAAVEAQTQLTAPQPQAQQGQPAPPAGAGGDTLGYLNSLIHNRGQQGQGASAQQPGQGPGVEAILPAVDAKVKATQALEEQRKTQARVNNAMAEVNKAYKESVTEKTDAQRKEIELKTSLMTVESHAKVALENAHAAAALQQIETSMEEMKLRREKFSFEKTQAEMKAQSTRYDAVGKMRTQMRSYSDEKTKLAKQMQEVDEGIAKSRTLLAPGFLEAQTNRDTGQKFTRAEADIMRVQTATIAETQARRRKEIAYLQRATDREITRINTALMESGANAITSPSGKPLPGATRGAIRAGQQAIRPAAVIPPGAPVVAGAQIGLYARPMQRAQSTPQRPASSRSRDAGKKAKLIRERSTADLWKALKGK